MNATALIAEDEPLLADNLHAELRKLWPELDIVAKVGNGEKAVSQALALHPDVMFLDIRMPGMTGLEAAQALAEDWPDGPPFPLMVFVTAYDQYAVAAFERSAIDYVLKPVQPDRLALTCERLKAALRQRTARNAPTPEIEAAIGQLRSLLGGSADSASASNSPQPARLHVLQAAVGANIHMVPVDSVVYFEAADKYVRVLTAEREYLIRTSLRELLPQLDPQRFWQIHRSVVVRADAIKTATREESGKVTLTLRDHADKLTASRLYAHLFKAM
jgi:DNA-binding LytR/AlgR family response regulator